MKFSKYTFGLSSDTGDYELTVTAQCVEAAKQIVLTTQNCPERSIKYWRKVPTAREIKKTKSMMRGL